MSIIEQTTCPGEPAWRRFLTGTFRYATTLRRRASGTSLTREGCYYLIVFALVLGGAVMREVNLLLILAGMMAGPIVLGWWATSRGLKGLKVQRRVPEGVCAGDLIVGQVQIDNERPGLGGWAIVVEDSLERIGNHRPDGWRRAKPVCPAVLFPFVPAGQSRRATYRGRLPRRGRYRLGPLRLSTQFPFGLLRKTREVGNYETLTVYPRLGRLTQRWMSRHHEAFSGTHRRERRHGTEGDFYGVRPWQTGDPLRWIHWRSTARLGAPVVQQFEQPRNRDVAVVLELWQPAAPGQAHRENVELAVSFAATVMADLCRRGGSDLLLATAVDRPLVNQGPASAALMHTMMEQLSVVEAHSEDRLPELLDAALRRIDRGTELVIVSTRPVRLADAGRFAALSADPGRRLALRRARVIDASHPDLEVYYHAD